MSKQDAPKVIGPDGWSWEGRWASPRRGIPALGIFLIVFGVLLVAGQFFSWAEYGIAAFFLAIGVVLIASGLRDKSDLALFVGVFMAALSLSGFLSAAKVISGGGWSTLFVGFGFMLAAVWRSSWGRRLGGAFVFGAIVAGWGAFQVAQSQWAFPTDRLIGPALLIVLGLWIVSRRMRATS